MNNLYEKRAMTVTYGPKRKRLTLYATRTIIFQRENLKYLVVCFTQCTLFFSTRLFSIANIFAVCFLWKMYVTICNERSRQVTTDRRSIKNHVLAK